MEDDLYATLSTSLLDDYYYSFNNNNNDDEENQKDYNRRYKKALKHIQKAREQQTFKETE